MLEMEIAVFWMCGLDLCVINISFLRYFLLIRHERNWQNQDFMEQTVFENPEEITVCECVLFSVYLAAHRLQSDEWTDGWMDGGCNLLRGEFLEQKRHMNQLESP